MPYPIPSCTCTNVAVGSILKGPVDPDTGISALHVGASAKLTASLLEYALEANFAMYPLVPAY